MFGGKSYAAARVGRVRRYISSQVTSDSVSRSETCRSVLFEIESPCILLFLNRNTNSQNSPKRMHPLISIQLIRRKGCPVEAYATIPKGFMGNGCLQLSDRISRCFRPQEKESIGSTYTSYLPLSR